MSCIVNSNNNGESHCQRLSLKLIWNRVAKKCVQFSCNQNVCVQTSGNVVLTGTRVGVATNFTGQKKLTAEYHTLILEQVQAWACHKWGANDDVWDIPPLALEMKPHDFTTIDRTGQQATSHHEAAVLHLIQTSVHCSWLDDCWGWFCHSLKQFW